VIDHQPGWLTPFYDDGTGVLFLAGKGINSFLSPPSLPIPNSMSHHINSGRTIYYHEVNPAAASIQLIDKFVAQDQFR
jgi:hypothetical protein